MAKLYDDRFFNWVDQTAIGSAQRMLPLVMRMHTPASVVDVGCGRGTWLAVWQTLGVDRVKGLDGAYVDRTRLAIATDSFEPADLCAPHTAGERFDIAQSLEVAEHLPASAGPLLIDRLCSLSDVVLFSAAQPGQGGEGHVNERNPSEWAAEFGARGYAAFDCLRPLMRHDSAISPWYRYNSMIFANEAGQKRLSAEAIAGRVERIENLDTAPIGDLAWALRRAILRPLPVAIVTRLSRVHYTLASMLHRHTSARPA